VRFSKLTSGRRGFTLIFAALAFAFFLVPLCGLAIDGGLAYAARTQLSMALDAAAMSGARALANGRNSGEQIANAQERARAVALANVPAGGVAGALTFETVRVDQPSDFRRLFTVTARVDVPTYFMRWFGYTTLPVRATAQAVRRDVNLAMVLDRSGSLASSRSCTPMKNAATSFVNRFAEGRDNVGLVTFATTTFVNFPMANNFKATVPGEIGLIDCGGGTNMSGGLWRGYEQLTALRQPDALNVILLFTDGLPTAAPLDMSISAGSSCTDKSPRRGVLFADGGNPSGIFKTALAARPIGSDFETISNAAGCAFGRNTGRVTSDVEILPDTDVFGNYLDNGYRAVNRAGGAITLDRRSAAGAVVNAVDSAAARIRLGTGTDLGPGLNGVLTFTIGLGAGVSDELLRRVANDRGSMIFDNTRPAGAYFFVADSSGLDEAFQRVASEVLRLAQ
jgi:Mg-chelatase subunit ChlD